MLMPSRRKVLLCSWLFAAMTALGTGLVGIAAGTAIDGGQFTVPEALGDKVIHPFGDYLLHDIGTGDGIVQVGPQDTANKLRTAPLWGLRTKARFMHDLESLSLENAIARHNGEAHDDAADFIELSPAQQEQLITFLKTL